MSKCVQSGILYGRPFGGVMTLVKKSFRKITETICSSERYIMIKVANYVINTKKNLRRFITVKAHCSMTHLKQQKSLGFF